MVLNELLACQPTETKVQQKTNFPSIKMVNNSFLLHDSSCNKVNFLKYFNYSIEFKY